jgi:quercetin dioxygenase-like cupin family protein
MSVATGQAKHVQRDAGGLRWWFEGLAAIKFTGQDTGGQFSLTEMLYPAGAVVPRHVHHREDEVFYVIDGEITMQIGEDSYRVGAGETIFAPRDVPHGFTVTSSNPVRYLILYTPAGYEGFILESSQPARQPALPPRPEHPPTQEQMDEIALLMATKFGCEFV